MQSMCISRKPRVTSALPAAACLGGLIALAFWSSGASAGELQKLLDESKAFAALPVMKHTPACYRNNHQRAENPVT